MEWSLRTVDVLAVFSTFSRPHHTPYTPHAHLHNTCSKTTSANRHRHHHSPNPETLRAPQPWTKQSNLRHIIFSHARPCPCQLRQVTKSERKKERKVRKSPSNEPDQPTKQIWKLSDRNISFLLTYHPLQPIHRL